MTSKIIIKKAPPPRKNQSKVLSFGEHLSEMRNRLVVSVLFFIAGSVIGYLIHPQILSFLTKPLNQPIFYSSPTGAFDFILRISLFFGFIVSLPVFIYQIIRFIEPALPKKYPKFLLLTILGSTILLAIGMAFAYWISLPAALYFLNKFSSQQVQSLISTVEYFSFITSYLIGFGLIFQLPLILLAINSITKIPVKKLFQGERWVILISFVAAAILTPTPDIFNQMIMALPLIILYQGSIILIWLINKK